MDFPPDIIITLRSKVFFLDSQKKFKKNWRIDDIGFIFNDCQREWGGFEKHD